MSPDARNRASRSITWRLLQLESVQRAGTVACYLSQDVEVATDDLIRSLQAIGKTVAAPRICKDAVGLMDMARIDTLGQLNPTRFGLREPSDDAPAWLQPEAGDVCIVPAVALTLRGERLGMGGGYYDRWLERHPQVTTIAPAFACQITDELPTEPHDIAMQWIVTQECVFDCRTA